MLCRAQLSNDAADRGLVSFRVLFLLPGEQENGLKNDEYSTSSESVDLED